MPSEVAGIKNPGEVHLNPSPAELIEHAIRRGEAKLSSTGALVAETGKFSGRSPKDRFFVRQSKSAERSTGDPETSPSSERKFDALYDRVREHLSGKDLFVIDGFIGADPQYRIKLRVVAELAWHALFAAAVVPTTFTGRSRGVRTRVPQSFVSDLRGGAGT